MDTIQYWAKDIKMTCFFNNNEKTKLSPAIARKNLLKLTENIFEDLMRELRWYLDCAPPDHDVTKAVGDYKDKARELRNGPQMGGWHPLVLGADKDKDADLEETKIHKDFKFILEYLRGPRHTQNQHGALTSATEPKKEHRANIFSQSTEWHNGLVDHLCKVYEIPTIGNQLKEISNLYDIITKEGHDNDTAVINEFKVALDKTSALNRHWSEDGWFSNFCRKAYNIISCVLFPIAGLRALNSRFMRGVWNFSKSDGEVFLDEANKNSVNTLECKL